MSPFVSEPRRRHRVSGRTRLRPAAALGVVTILWAVLLVPGAASAQNTDPSAAVQTWTGTWATSWTGDKVGSVTAIFIQDGNEVAGDPTGELPDKLPGFIDGGFYAGLPTPETLVGEWIDDKDRGGTFTLTLSRDGTTWSGPWTDEGAAGTWSGTCIAGACLDNVGDAVTAPTTAALETATTQATTATTLPETTATATPVSVDADVPVEDEGGASTALLIGVLIGIPVAVGGGAVIRRKTNASGPEDKPEPEDDEPRPRFADLPSGKQRALLTEAMRLEDPSLTAGQITERVDAILGDQAKAGEIWKTFVEGVDHDLETHDWAERLARGILKVADEAIFLTSKDFMAAFGTELYVDWISGRMQDRVLATVVELDKGANTAAADLATLVTKSPELVGLGWDYLANASSDDLLALALDGGVTLPADALASVESKLGDLRSASLSGDDAKVAAIIGEIGGAAQFDAILGAGILKVFELRRPKVKVDGPRAPTRTLTHTDIDNQGPTRRPGNEEVTVRQLEEDFGYEDFTAQHLDAKAKEHGVIIEMKPANPASLDMIKRGDALAKPEGLKPKTTNAEDLKLGAPPGSEGKVSFFEPQKPRGFDDLPTDHPLVERYNTRADQWQKYQKDMTELQLPPSERSPAFQDAIRRQYGSDSPLHIEIRDGLIYDKATGKPFTGDYDVWGFRDATTGNYVSPARADQIYNDLGYAANPQHGPGTAHWQPDDPSLQKLKQTLQREHSAGNPNGQNLLQFSGKGLPTTAWVD